MTKDFKSITKWDKLRDLRLIGRTFELDKKTYKFTKFMPRAKKNPVVAVRVSDGTVHRFGWLRVSKAFWQQINAATLPLLKH